MTLKTYIIPITPSVPEARVNLFHGFVAFAKKSRHWKLTPSSSPEAMFENLRSTSKVRLCVSVNPKECRVRYVVRFSANNWKCRAERLKAQRRLINKMKYNRKREWGGKKKGDILVDVCITNRRFRSENVFIFFSRRERFMRDIKFGTIHVHVH